MKASTTITIQALAATLTLAAVSATAQTNPPGLVSLWSAEGNAADSVSTNHGILHGGVAFQFGRVGQAFQFDGTSGYVQVPDSPSLDLRSEATLMAWIALDQRPSEAGHFMNVVAKAQSGNDLDCQVETDDRVRFYVGPGAGNGSFVSSTTVLQSGVWYHVAATYRASDRVEIFINGVQESTTPITVTRQVNTNPLTIGWNTVFAGRFFRGRIDQVRVFDRAVSEDTVNDIFTAERGAARAPGRFANLSYSPTTGFSFIFRDGTVGRPYQIQISTSLTQGSWLDWLDFTYLGPIGITDFSAPETERRFYRAVSP